MLHGKITVTVPRPIGLLAAYQQARGFECMSELATAIGCSRQAISKACRGEGCGKGLARRIEMATGLPAPMLVFEERRCTWSFEIDNEGRATILVLS